MRFKPEAIHTPGKDMIVADTLSRSPVSTHDSINLQEDVHVFASEVISSWPVSDAKLNKIRKETQKDVNLKTALEYTISGWPVYKEKVKLAARNLFAIRGELSVIDGILMRGDRILIPDPLRREILVRIHDGHLGITKCREHANQCVWWPGISKDIQERVVKYRHCLEKQRSHPSEPLLTSMLPD